MIRIKAENAEQYYSSMRSKIQEAGSVNAMLDIMVSEFQTGVQDRMRSYYKRMINKTCRGDLERARMLMIQELNSMEHNYYAE